MRYTICRGDWFQPPLPRSGGTEGIHEKISGYEIVPHWGKCPKDKRGLSGNLANPTIVIGLERDGNLVMNPKIGKEIVMLRNNDRL